MGLYSQYLLRYGCNLEGEQRKYYLKDFMFLDHPIMAISKGDIFDIGLYYMIVVTTRSVWVVGPKAISKLME